MSKVIETASSLLAAASMIVLALGCAILTRPSWADEPLHNTGLCTGCASGVNYCNACKPKGDCVATSQPYVCQCNCDPNSSMPPSYCNDYFPDWQYECYMCTYFTIS